MSISADSHRRHGAERRARPSTLLSHLYQARYRVGWNDAGGLLEVEDGHGDDVIILQFCSAAPGLELEDHCRCHLLPFRSFTVPCCIGSVFKEAPNSTNLPPRAVPRIPLKLHIVPCQRLQLSGVVVYPPRTSSSRQSRRFHLAAGSRCYLSGHKKYSRIAVLSRCPALS